MDIERLHNDKNNPYPEVRGVVEGAEMLFGWKFACLKIKINGTMYFFESRGGLPTILVGQEVILHLKEKGGSNVVFGIQIIADDKCYLRVCNIPEWATFK